jgi:hypothetical protein
MVSILSYTTRLSGVRRADRRRGSRLPSTPWEGRLDGTPSSPRFVAVRRIEQMVRSHADWPGGKAGDVVVVGFVLMGQRYQALNNKFFLARVEL